jgi:hypothetical protein
MSDDRVVRGISWRDCCPWLILPQTLRLATSAQLVTLALAGVILVSLGWRLVGWALLPPDLRRGDSKAAVAHQWLQRWPGGRGPVRGLARAVPLPPATAPAREVAPFDPVIDAPLRIVEPFRRLFDPTISWRQLAYFLVGGVLTLAIWAPLGGAITRTAAVRLGLDERVGLRQSLRFAGRKWSSLFLAPSLSLGGMVLLGLPIALLGWIMRLDVGVVLAGLLWIPVLVGAFLIAILGLGLMLGWPLMWGTISTENSDAFDAISRSYAYTFQRPLHYLFYALVAAVLGSLGWLLLWWFVESIVAFGYWAACWGAGSPRLIEIVAAGRADTGSEAADFSTTLSVGAHLIVFCVGLLRATASGVSYSYFWCCAAAIYLLLRRDTDQTELDDIVVEDEDETPYGLPPLEPDEAGVPGVTDETTPEPAEAHETEGAVDEERDAR